MQTKFLIDMALAAALTFSAAQASAQHGAEPGVPHFKSPGLVGEPGVSRGVGRCHAADRHFAHRDTGVGCGGNGSAYADSEWAVYNNRSWDPDSYNDWWHERPDRAFPRWVQEQRARGTCDPDRVWWSGGGWHC